MRGLEPCLFLVEQSIRTPCGVLGTYVLRYARSTMYEYVVIYMHGVLHCLLLLLVTIYGAANLYICIAKPGVQVRGPIRLTMHISRTTRRRHNPS